MEGFEKELSKTPREVQERFKGEEGPKSGRDSLRPMNVPMMKMSANLMKKKGGRRQQQGLLRQREGGKGRLGRQLSKQVYYCFLIAYIVYLPFSKVIFDSFDSKFYFQMSLLMPKIRATPFPTETPQDKYGHLYLIIRPSEIELYKFTGYKYSNMNPHSKL